MTKVQFPVDDGLVVVAEDDMLEVIAHEGAVELRLRLSAVRGDRLVRALLRALVVIEQPGYVSVAPVAEAPGPPGPVSVRAPGRSG